MTGSDIIQTTIAAIAQGELVTGVTSSAFLCLQHSGIDEWPLPDLMMLLVFTFPCEKELPEVIKIPHIFRKSVLIRNVMIQWAQS